jgi:hypothetical protein
MTRPRISILNRVLESKLVVAHSSSGWTLIAFTIATVLGRGLVYATPCRVQCKPAIQRCVSAGNKRARCRRQLRHACLVGQGACDQAFLPATTSTTNTMPTTSTTSTINTTMTSTSTTTTTLPDMTGSWTLNADLLTTTCPDSESPPASLTQGLDFTQTGQLLLAFPTPQGGNVIIQGAFISADDFSVTTGPIPMSNSCTLMVVLQGTVVASNLVDPARAAETLTCSDSGTDCSAIYSGTMTR